jgi:Zn ribbon nucleic-acid-binding protein
MRKKSIGKCEICGEEKWLALKRVKGIEIAICKKCFEEEKMIDKGECVPLKKQEIKNLIFLLKDYSKMLQKEYGHLHDTYSGFGYMSRQHIIGLFIKRLNRKKNIKIDEYCAMCGHKTESIKGGK